MTTPKTSPYLKFLNLLDSIDHMNPGKKLDCIEENLLDKIVSCAQAKQAILVGELISLTRLTSHLARTFEKSECIRLYQNGSQ